jgi:hypothetical protein
MSVRVAPQPFFSEAIEFPEHSPRSKLGALMKFRLLGTTFGTATTGLTQN